MEWDGIECGVEGTGNVNVLNPANGTTQNTIHCSHMIPNQSMPFHSQSFQLLSSQNKRGMVSALRDLSHWLRRGVGVSRG